MSKIIKSGQTVYQDMEVGIYQDALPSGGENPSGRAEDGERNYTLISEEKRHILEHAKTQAKQSTAAILAQAYAQRDKIVNTAEEEAVRIKAQAEKDGYEDGLEKVLSTVSGTLDRLEGELAHTGSRLAEQVEDIRGQILELALSIASRILEKRIEEDSGELTDLVKQAIRFERDKKQIEVHISAKAEGLARELEKELEPLQEKYGNSIRLRREEAPTDRVRIETSDGILDASAFRQLEQLKKQLSSLEEELL